ncbi:MAG: ferritin-like domain-containing protein [Planctomycetota bacterium]|jgi:rubrerythrin
MPVTISVFDVAKFYRKAAEICDGLDVRKMFLKLAEWEVEHERIFAHMKKQLPELNKESGTFGYQDTLPDPKVMAGLAVFGLRSDPAPELGDRQSTEEIIRRALEKEKDSIVFYEGLKDFIVAGADRGKIDDIIREEMRHIRILYESLNQDVVAPLS